ncbi:hypothetical protein PRZ48_004666 [Zasmidium cellare]|uniref:NAD(P)-binding protein n=1 Tax=Zasmidium cellare TaxID=395010 RepID=A0ABR0ERJ5_ZASCE|nr:hypothetical protein PRZ48_004666 [Zasmidium cellare]
MPFQYKKVLVLGGTSGIGKAMAEKFLDEGSAVIVVGRRKENLDAFAQEHGSKAEGKVDTVVFDITDLKGIPSFANDIISKHPDLDCVFINAGIQRHLLWQEPEKVDLDLAEKEFTTNYTSPLHLTKAFLPFLQKQAPKPTSLVFVTSGLALVPNAHQPGYCASKAALHHMVLAMRLQMKEIESNVKIVELLPPAVQTELHDDKHQPEFQGKGAKFGMPLDEFTEEAYEGLSAGEEHVPVQAARTFMGYGTWEQERQKAMVTMWERQRAQK